MSKMKILHGLVGGIGILLIVLVAAWSFQQYTRW